MKGTTYRAPDGVTWNVAVQVPGSSNALVVFGYPGDPHRNRYNWFLANGPDARNVTGHLQVRTVLNALDEPALARLFRRSMPIRPAGTGPRGSRPLTQD